MEAKLNQRLEQLGFKIVDGRLFGAVDDQGNTVPTILLEEQNERSDLKKKAAEGSGRNV